MGISMVNRDERQLVFDTRLKQVNCKAAASVMTTSPDLLAAKRRSSVAIAVFWGVGNKRHPCLPYEFSRFQRLPRVLPHGISSGRSQSFTPLSIKLRMRG
jgi:hypothetical protein